MARGKAAVVSKDTRPSLDEVKAKTGKYVVITYRGYESGGISVSAPDPYEMGLPVGYTPKDLLIEPWVWRVIPSYWLDDGRFAAIYQKDRGIYVDKVDVIPENEDLTTLPNDLEKKLTRERKQKAWWIATQPYDPNARADSPSIATHAVIFMKLMETTDDSPEQVDFLQNELVPILQAAKYYEERLGNRQEVIKDIDKRLDEISGKKVFRTSRRVRRKA